MINVKTLVLAAAIAMPSIASAQTSASTVLSPQGPTLGSKPGVSETVRDPQSSRSTITLDRSEVNQTGVTESAFGSALGYADLATGRIGADAVAGANTLARAETGWSDTIFFNIANASASTTTDILLRLAVSGTLQSVGGGASADYRLFAGTGNLLLQRSLGSNPGTPEVFNLTQTGFTSFEHYTENNTTFILAGLRLTGAAQRLELSSSLTVAAQASHFANSNPASASARFGNTAVFNFDLPSNVTFTSASGVFLSAASPVGAVPEPSTWAMMLLGFGAIGFAMRRSRKNNVRVRFAY